MSKEVRLIENFASWQGEGPDSGRNMIILRFKTCNLACPWCDTAVKMRISSEAPYKLDEIQANIHDRKAGILITGGEPTVPKHFDETAMLLNDLNYPIANVESNGFKLYELIGEVDPKKPIKFIYSPKIFSDKDIQTAIDTVNKLAGHNKVYIKVVYDGSNHIMEFLEFLGDQEDLLWEQRIWLMPEGITRPDLIKNAERTFDLCEKFRFNFSSRSHIMFGFV
ncbi:MAG: radical SAM protein [Candidatus Heimdallarchaeaceae archaeon]